MAASQSRRSLLACRAGRQARRRRRARRRSYWQANIGIAAHARLGLEESDHPAARRMNEMGGKKYSRHRPDADACPAVRSSRPPAGAIRRVKGSGGLRYSGEVGN
ncbi:hypothetical protein PAHAL_2G098900 [Panicum hallii]|uniref:Uncharacterized protein n=1 Tax=Panicum hallii TaxID=206008 RepID=A0A2S3GX61_9POAL|nr:hypothetical protein PAHAL_2G098900 [Panicum hallii]